MFDELSKYKDNGHFFFQKGENLSKVSGEVPDAPGVYYILRLAEGRVDLAQIGKAGTVNPKGAFNGPLLNEGIRLKQDFLEEKIRKEGIDGLDIYWFVTWDEDYQDLPAYVEGLIMQQYFDVHGMLPPWNDTW